MNVVDANTDTTYKRKQINQTRLAVHVPVLRKSFPYKNTQFHDRARDVYAVMQRAVTIGRRIFPRTMELGIRQARPAFFCFVLSVEMPPATVFAHVKTVRCHRVCSFDHIRTFCTSAFTIDSADTSSAAKADLF